MFRGEGLDRAFERLKYRQMKPRHDETPFGSRETLLRGSQKYINEAGVEREMFHSSQKST